MSINRYTLTDEVKATYKPIIAEFLGKIAAMTDDELCNADDSFKLDLSNTKLNPYTLGTLLEEEFGYGDKDHDDNGWQMDFWLTYTKSVSDITKKVVISGTGIIFEMFLCVDVE